MPVQELGNTFVEMKTIEVARKKLQEINEHIKKEQNSLNTVVVSVMFLNG
jgi:hypothetical protein